MQTPSQWDRMDRSNVVKTTDELKFTIPELGYFLLPAIEFKIYIDKLLERLSVSQVLVLDTEAPA